MPTSDDSPTDPTQRTDQQMFDDIKTFLALCPMSGPRAAAIADLIQLQEHDARRKRILKLVQEALSQLRVDMKYMIFDLEATRRERDLYKAELDRLNGGN